MSICCNGPCRSCQTGSRAVSKDRPISPSSVEHYLESKFGDNLGSAMRAMVKLAQSMPTEEIGVTGCGAASELDLDLIKGLSERR